MAKPFRNSDHHFAVPRIVPVKSLIGDVQVCQIKHRIAGAQRIHIDQQRFVSALHHVFQVQVAVNQVEIHGHGVQALLQLLPQLPRDHIPGFLQVIQENIPAVRQFPGFRFDTVQLADNRCVPADQFIHSVRFR